MKTYSEPEIVQAMQDYERFRKNRYISDIMIEKMKSVLLLIGEHGSDHRVKSDSACWGCDMGGAGRSFKGEGYHDDDCPIKEAQLLYEEMFGPK